MLQDHPEGVILNIRLQPAAKRTAIVGMHGDALKIAVTAPPEDGRANKMLLELLRHSLVLDRTQVALLSGATNRNKRVLVQGVTREQLMRRIGLWNSAKKAR
jgi:uncharacterized protein (TIGR00251 family)